MSVLEMGSEVVKPEEAVAVHPWIIISDDDCGGPSHNSLPEIPVKYIVVNTKQVLNSKCSDILAMFDSDILTLKVLFSSGMSACGLTSDCTINPGCS